MPFYKHDWYTDHSDSRCPHDAWLENICISESASGARKELRTTKIVVRLLGAYHDGTIELVYLGVTEYSLPNIRCNSGHGDWLSDCITTEEGKLHHQIDWSGGATGTVIWKIVAESVSYSWIPYTQAS